MPDEILLNEAAHAVWQTVKEHGPIELGEAAKQAGVDQSQVSAVAAEAAAEGFFQIESCEREELTASETAKQRLDAGLPEFWAALQLRDVPEMPTQMLIELAKKFGIAINDVFKWSSVRGTIDRERSKADNKDIVRITASGRRGISGTKKDDDIRALDLVFERGAVFLDELAEFSIDHARVRQLLSNRPELAKIKQRTIRTLNLTTVGWDALQKRVRVIKERNSLTPEDLESGAWREIKLRPYDVKLPAKDVYPAKIHPLRKIIEQTRRAFLEMGFAEVASPMVESAFWNFDALFQPQDHPAREMQDTFYMRHPATTPLPGEEKGVRNHFSGSGGDSPSDKMVPDTFFANQDGTAILENVRRTHEDGWETGSEGWGYKWSPEVSKKVVLRTHTTAATIRALAANPNPPGKFFCVGWTYRNETISFKHLPVFHQVDGMIIDEEANLASLMGTLQEFYSKMGFGRVKFKPAFYPYTEPSVDVVVYMESRGKWLEMGGAGIFRPEVTLPLGCKHPVLAWGLGIERLAMLRFGLSDIRELYGTNLNELEKVPLCR